MLCRELGYTGSSAIYSGSANIQGNYSLWINSVQCTGNESSLVSCAHDEWTPLGCVSGQKTPQIAGAVCTGPEGNEAVNVTLTVLFFSIAVRHKFTILLTRFITISVTHFVMYKINFTS